MQNTLQAQVEQKFYLRWVNFILYPTHQIASLNDLRDGYLLVKICELVLDVDEEESVLRDPFQDTTDSTQDPSMTATTKLSKGKMREWAENNLGYARSYCERMKADVSHITDDDILKGKIPSIVNYVAAIVQAVYVYCAKFQGVSGELALLQWVREIAMGSLPAGMTSFSGCWNDGFALNVVSLFPEKEVDEKVISSLKQFTPLERVTVALRTITDKGVPAVFDAPDIAMGTFTARCMRAYIGMLFSVYQNVPLNIIAGVKKEKEKIEQYNSYRIRKEEAKMIKEEEAAREYGFDDELPTSSFMSSPPATAHGSALTTPHQ